MTTLDAMERAGKIRDGLLVGASIVYILGYVTWSIYAWRLGLGAVDVIDAQYFAAGLPVAAVLALSLIWANVLRSMADGLWRRFLSERSRAIHSVTEGILLIAALGSSVVGAVFTIRTNPSERSLSTRMLIVALLIFGYSTLQLLLSKGTRPHLERFTRSFVRVIYVFAGFILIDLFIFQIYPTLPAPFGGKPRAAQLDLRADLVSPQTVCALTGAPTALRTGVVRTKAIWILTSRTEMVVLLEEPTVSRTPPITLRNDSVTAVIWR